MIVVTGMSHAAPPRTRARPLERCALRAQLRGDPMLGTAFPAARLLLVEQPGAWGLNGLRESRFDAGAAAALEARARAGGIRVQAIRRPGRTPRGAVRRWALVDTRDGAESLRWGTYDARRRPARPAARRLRRRARRPRRSTSSARTASTTPAARCAAGRSPRRSPQLRPGRVWECSHLGGDRFAANVLVLPAGLLYGRVLPFAAAGVRRRGRGRRGRRRAAARPDRAAGRPRRRRSRSRTSTWRCAAVATCGSCSTGAGRRRRGDGAAATARTAQFDVAVRVERVACAGADLRNPGPNRYLAYRPVGLTPVED